MKEIEIAGRNLEEAIELAAEALGVASEDVQHEVLEESGKGFLGLGHTRVKVRAWTETAPTSIEETEPVVVEETQPVEEELKAEAAEDQGEEVLEIMRRVMDAMQLDARPELREVTPGEIRVDLIGPDVAILIGKHGHTLDALQYLVGIVINRKSPERTRLILDAEGYRERQQKALEQRASEIAESVKRSGQEAVLDPLPARDRRIVHLYLAEDPDVETYSEGDGENRRVVISPKNS